MMWHKIKVLQQAETLNTQAQTKTKSVWPTVRDPDNPEWDYNELSGQYEGSRIACGSFFLTLGIIWYKLLSHCSSSWSMAE